MEIKLCMLPMCGATVCVCVVYWNGIAQCEVLFLVFYQSTNHFISGNYNADECSPFFYVVCDARSKLV